MLLDCPRMPGKRLGAVAVLFRSDHKHTHKHTRQSILIASETIRTTHSKQKCKLRPNRTPLKQGWQHVRASWLRVTRGGGEGVRAATLFTYGQDPGLETRDKTNTMHQSTEGEQKPNTRFTHGLQKHDQCENRALLYLYLQCHQNT